MRIVQNKIIVWPHEIWDLIWATRVAEAAFRISVRVFSIIDIDETSQTCPIFSYQNVVVIKLISRRQYTTVISASYQFHYFFEKNLVNFQGNILS